MLRCRTGWLDLRLGCYDRDAALNGVKEDLESAPRVSFVAETRMRMEAKFPPHSGSSRPITTD
jgi:hypothetical protein